MSEEKIHTVVAQGSKSALRVSSAALKRLRISASSVLGLHLSEKEKVQLLSSSLTDCILDHEFSLTTKFEPSPIPK